MPRASRIGRGIAALDGQPSEPKRALKQRIARARKIYLGCADCGYRRHAEALQFDHRPDEIKVGNIAGWKGDVPSMIEEMNKCDVVCANCHAVRTALRRTQPRLVRVVRRPVGAAGPVAVNYCCAEPTPETP